MGKTTVFKSRLLVSEARSFAGESSPFRDGPATSRTGTKTSFGKFAKNKTLNTVVNGPRRTLFTDAFRARGETWRVVVRRLVSVKNVRSFGVQKPENFPLTPGTSVRPGRDIARFRPIVKGKRFSDLAKGKTTTRTNVAGGTAECRQILVTRCFERAFGRQFHVSEYPERCAVRYRLFSE